MHYIEAEVHLLLSKLVRAEHHLIGYIMRVRATARWLT